MFRFSLAHISILGNSRNIDNIAFNYLLLFSALCYAYSTYFCCCEALVVLISFYTALFSFCCCTIFPFSIIGIIFYYGIFYAFLQRPPHTRLRTHVAAYRDKESKTIIINVWPDFVRGNGPMKSAYNLWKGRTASNCASIRGLKIWFAGLFSLQLLQLVTNSYTVFVRPIIEPL